MNKQEKDSQVKYVSERFQKAKAVIFAGYRGLKVEEINELRHKLRAGKSALKVVKNRLAKIALKNLGIKDLDSYLKDPTAIAYSDHDLVEPAKILMNFAKDHGSLIIRGGFLEGKPLTFKEVDALSKLPSREEMIARALSSMLAPASKFAYVLKAVPRSLVIALAGVRDKKKETHN